MFMNIILHAGELIQYQYELSVFLMFCIPIIRFYDISFCDILMLEPNSKMLTQEVFSLRKYYITYLLALILFGSNGIVASMIDLTSYDIVFLRSAIGSLFLLTLFLLGKNRFTCLTYRSDWLFISLSGIAMAADWLLLFEAYQRIGVSLGMLINYCGPVLVVALSPLVFRESITKRKLTALLSAFCGAILISGSALSAGIDFIGLLCAVLSAFSYAGMILCNKKSTHIDGLENSLLQLLAAAVTITLFVGIRYGLYIPVSSDDLIPVLWIGLINTGLTCFLYFSSVSKLPVQTVAICGYLEPVSAVLLSFLLLNESMTIIQIIGAILIIGGAVFGETK